MFSFKFGRTEAEKAQRQAIKELEREAKAQRKRAAKEHKAQQAREKQEQKEAKRLEKQVQQQVKQQQKEEKKRYRKAAKVAKKATKMRRRMARKAEKERARSRGQQQNGAADTVEAPPFAKSGGCFVCGKKFGQALQRRRHHCRQCRESCCLQCMSRTRHAIPLYGLHKPQKVCVVCETLIFTVSDAPREPAEALEALASMTHTSTSRRPHSAPLPSTTGVTTSATPSRQRSRSRSFKSRSGSIWMLPIRPLLRKKSSAEQLRNRTMDLDLQIDKRALMSGPVIHVQPQAIASPAS